LFASRLSFKRRAYFHHIIFLFYYIFYSFHFLLYFYLFYQALSLACMTLIRRPLQVLGMTPMWRCAHPTDRGAGVGCRRGSLAGGQRRPPTPVPSIPWSSSHLLGHSTHPFVDLCEFAVAFSILHVLVHVWILPAMAVV